MRISWKHLLVLFIPLLFSSSCRPLSISQDQLLISCHDETLAQKTKIEGVGANAPERDRAIIGRILLNDVGPTLRKAYREKLKAEDTGSGLITVKFMIFPDGSVSKSQIMENEFTDWPELEDLVLKKLSGVKFAPTSAGVVMVTLPLKLIPYNQLTQCNSLDGRVVD